jgi:hypothetical protein
MTGTKQVRLADLQPRLVNKKKWRSVLTCKLFALVSSVLKSESRVLVSIQTRIDLTLIPLYLVIAFSVGS